jgi:hypothetical protein
MQQLIIHSIQILMDLKMIMLHVVLVLVKLVQHAHSADHNKETGKQKQDLKNLSYYFIVVGYSQLIYKNCQSWLLFVLYIVN